MAFDDYDEARVSESECFLGFEAIEITNGDNHLRVRLLVQTSLQAIGGTHLGLVEKLGGSEAEIIRRNEEPPRDR